MYNLDSIVKHPHNVEVKIVEISKAMAKRKSNFNDKDLDVNQSHGQTQNVRFSHKCLDGDWCICYALQHTA